jgi:hypothetical protein
MNEEFNCDAIGAATERFRGGFSLTFRKITANSEIEMMISEIEVLFPDLYRNRAEKPV